MNSMRRRLHGLLVGIPLAGCTQADPGISLKLAIGANSPAKIESIVLDDFPILTRRDGGYLFVSHKTTSHEARVLPSRLRPVPGVVHARWRYQRLPQPDDPAYPNEEGPWIAAEQTVPLRAAVDSTILKRLTSEGDRYRLMIRLRFDHDRLIVFVEAEPWR